MRLRLVATCLAAGGLLGIAQQPGQAQVTTAPFYAVIADPTGAAVPGATATGTEAQGGAHQRWSLTFPPRGNKEIPI